MLKRFVTAVCSIAAGLAMFTASAAAEPQFSRAPASVLPAAHDGDYRERVCCKRGNYDWWTTRGECYRQGGQQTYNRSCRRDGPWEDGGGGGGNNWDPRWNERVCCIRQERGGYRVFWSTRGECFRSRGKDTYNKTCRKHGGFHPNRDGYYGPGYGPGPYDDDGYGWGQDPQGGGDPNGRVCCVRDGRVWWASRRDCQRAWGTETYNRTCRNN